MMTTTKKKRPRSTLAESKMKRFGVLCGYMALGGVFGAVALLVMMSCWALKEFAGMPVTITICALIGLAMAWVFWTER